MTPHRRPPDDPIEWLNRAKSSLTRAKTRLEGVYLEDLCFDAQQAAEKAVKALLIARQVEFPYVHDLSRLLTLLEETGEEIPTSVRLAEALTPYAIVARYPGVVEPLTEERYHTAVELAEAVVRWASQQLAEPP
jgi:HEPN domain-containing protein